MLLRQEQTGEQRILSRLTREAATRAGQQTGHPASGSVRWDIASRTVVKAMLGAGVLLAPDGRPVPAGIEALATPVAVVREEYQDITEAFCSKFLVLSTVAERLRVARPFEQRMNAGRIEIAARLASQATVTFGTKVEKDMMTGRLSKSLILQMAFKTVN